MSSRWLSRTRKARKNRRWSRHKQSLTNKSLIRSRRLRRCRGIWWVNVTACSRDWQRGSAAGPCARHHRSTTWPCPWTLTTPRERQRPILMKTPLMLTDPWWRPHRWTWPVINSSSNNNLEIKQTMNKTPTNHLQSLNMFALGKLVWKMMTRFRKETDQRPPRAADSRTKLVKLSAASCRSRWPLMCRTTMKRSPI